jgi:predicted ATP-dependent serine protease
MSPKRCGAVIPVAYRCKVCARRWKQIHGMCRACAHEDPTLRERMAKAAAARAAVLARPAERPSVDRGGPRVVSADEVEYVVVWDGSL